jgi:hypothetical protein
MTAAGTLRKQVDEYARKRASGRGDIYGWTILQVRNGHGEQDEILFLVSEKADARTFPDEIAGHKVQLKRISPPEPQAVGQQCGCSKL